MCRGPQKATALAQYATVAVGYSEPKGTVNFSNFLDLFK
jgi:hypothetical protein